MQSFKHNIFLFYDDNSIYHIVKWHIFMSSDECYSYYMTICNIFMCTDEYYSSQIWNAKSLYLVMTNFYWYDMM